MAKNTSYFKYEEKVGTAHLMGKSGIETFKMGLELSELALKMFYRSFQNQYKNISQKSALNKFRAFLRSI